MPNGNLRINDWGLQRHGNTILQRVIRTNKDALYTTNCYYKQTNGSHTQNIKIYVSNLDIIKENLMNTIKGE